MADPASAGDSNCTASPDCAAVEWLIQPHHKDLCAFSVRRCLPVVWLALPEADEETDPAFHHTPNAAIAALAIDGVTVRVMMDTAFGVTSPVKVFAQTLYVEAQLRAGQSLVLPDAPERALYLAQGQVRVGSTDVRQHAMAVLRASSADVTVNAQQASRIALIGGEPLGRRFLEWNFVSSRKERIEQAKQDWHEGRFPKVPGDEVEFIPLPQ